jgi:hypothetical protein
MNAETCLTAAQGEVVIDGFRITNATEHLVLVRPHVRLDLRNCALSSGEAIVAAVRADEAGAMRIQACRFIGIEANAAVSASHMGDAAIIGCDFEACRGYSAIVSISDCPYVSVAGCEFAGNVPSSGSVLLIARALDVSVSHTLIHDSARDPQGTHWRAPLAIYDSGVATIDACSFLRNDSGSGQGGAVFVEVAFEALINRCRFEGNASDGEGGAIYAPISMPGYLTIADSLIAGNLARGGHGGGISTFRPVTLERCTVAANTALRTAGAGIFGDFGNAPDLESAIIWGNTALEPGPVVQVHGLQPNSADNSIIEGLAPWLGKLGLDPLFVAPDDFRLRPGSPAINLGLNPANDPLNGMIDLAGNPRVRGRFVDAGCYEAAVTSGCGPADLTRTAVRGQPGYRLGDDTVNNDDFFVYLDAFARGDAAADLTGAGIPGIIGYGVPNGQVNNEDFFFYLVLFMQGC